MKTAAVCIATYRREDGLSRLLAAVRDQACPEGWAVEVRVINNDPEADAEAWCAYTAARHPGVRCDVERRRNIAHARNAAVAMGRADAFLFIDDDEVPAAGWLRALLRRVEEADAMFGPVIGHPAAGTAAWLTRSGAFDKPGPDHDGELHWTQTRTSSTAVAGAWIGRAGRWFDPDYGTSGGSDVEFFRRIAGEGARFVHERRALVYEDIEPDRCNWRAVLRRRYRAGAVHGRMHRAGGSLARHAQVLKRTAHGCAFVVAGLPGLAMGRPGLMFHGMCRVAVGVGAWRGHDTSYRVTRYPAKQVVSDGGAACVSPC